MPLEDKTAEGPPEIVFLPNETLLPEFPWDEPLLPEFKQDEPTPTKFSLEELSLLGNKHPLRVRLSDGRLLDEPSWLGRSVVVLLFCGGSE